MLLHPAIHLDITVSELDPIPEIKTILKHVRPTWEFHQVQFKTSPKEAARGVLNTMVVCSMDPDLHDAIMVRVYNEKFNEYTNRERETRNIQLIHNLYGFAPEILLTFINGFCYNYIHGEIMTPDTVRLEKNWRLIAKQLALFHSTKFEEDQVDMSKVQEFYCKPMKDFPTKLKNPDQNDRLKKELPTAEFIISESEKVYQHVLNIGSPLVFCHNDSRAENMVWNEKAGTITFVDYETAGFAYQASEIAYHFWRYAGIEKINYDLVPDKQFQLNWLKVYLESYYKQNEPEKEVTDKDVERLYVQVSNFYLLLQFSTIGCVRYMEKVDFLDEIPLDFMDLSIASYKEYCRRKDEILSMKLPD